METPSTPTTHKANVEQCLHCAYFHALGCAGTAHYCLRHNAFIVHDAGCGKSCHYYEEEKG